MNNKYIGIKRHSEKQGVFESTNLGIIFTKQKDGSYVSSKDGSFKVTEEEIKHDLNRGYLEPYVESRITIRQYNWGGKGGPIFREFNKTMKLPETEDEKEKAVNEIVKAFNELNNDMNIKAVKVK